MTSANGGQLRSVVLERPAGVLRPEDAGRDVRATGKDRNFIEPLSRGLSVMQAFAPSNSWMGNLEVADRVGLPTATVNRLLKTLHRLGYLTFSPQRRQYRLSASVLSLGYVAVANSNVRQLLRSHMQKIADELNVFVTLGQRDRLDIVLMEMCHSNASLLTLRLEPGARIPIAETAMGWALMAALPEEERDYLLAHIERKQRSRWPAVERDILRALSQIKRVGYCASLGAWRPEITTVAVPLVPADRSAALVIGCSTASPYLPPSRITQQIGPMLVQLVNRLSQELPGAEI